MFFTSCDKDQGQAPIAPSVESFIIDMSDFDKTPTQRLNTNYEHFNFAVKSLNDWKTLIKAYLDLPINAYKEATKQAAIYQTSQFWLWTCDFDLMKVNYSASLFGRVKNDSVNWNMYVSSEGVFKDFMCLKGQSSLNHHQGYWRLKDNAVDNKEIIKIEWSELNNTIKYTDISSEKDQKGNYIEAGVLEKNDNNFTNYLKIYDASKAVMTEIQWDKITKKGRVKNTQYFKNEDWHCWNSELENDDCLTTEQN